MLASKQIVVVEDEIDILDLISLHLKKERYNVRGFLNGYSVMKYLETERPSLLVLDLMLPDIDGFEICRLLRAKPDLASIPIIIITARSTETDKVLGLGLGADDYMVKPFSPRELVARVKAVLRRTGRQETEKEKEEEKIEIGDILRIDLQKYEVVVEGVKVDLTATEFRILQLLASRNGWVFSREKILTHLWGSNKMVLDRTIDVHIKHLREKMGKAGALIKNMRGIGYKLAT
jgi:two-component system phosphate regulon response regulator PhoB/two-component system alkaline phosphatase synthesis response regulator PhoP